jgi:hypothetical protein
MEVFKLIQISVALPAYTAPSSTTIGCALLFVIALPMSLLSPQTPTDWGAILKCTWLLSLLLFSQWACWSIFADVLEDSPEVRHLLLLLVGLLLTLLLGAFAWHLMYPSPLALLCGLQGIVASVLLMINLFRKKRQATSVIRD